jgi:flagellar hook assembly protein FlgD
MTNSTSFTISIPKTFRDVSGSRETAGSRGVGLAPASTEVRTDVDVAVYNVLGQRIKTIYSNSRYGGLITRTWDGADWNGKLVPSGVYFLYVRAGDLKETKKIIVIR